MEGKILKKIKIFGMSSVRGIRHFEGSNILDNGLNDIFSSSNGNPPSYQCVMMPQQIQFVPQQFQVVPTNQHMIVNSQGQVHS